MQKILKNKDKLTEKVHTNVRLVLYVCANNVR